MKSKRMIVAIMAMMFIMFLSGCVATVGTPPPYPHVEARPLIPFAGAVWIEGHYIHRHGRYIWEPGRYVKPPYPGAHWRQGYWEKHRRGWRWNKGHWDRKDRGGRYRRGRDDRQRHGFEN